ncbi:MAG: protein kinase [Spirulinaceae cyanobacterium]
MIGKLLDGRYQVVKVLGAGGFGKTYVAQDTRRPGNPVCVVKQLEPATRDANFLLAARRLFNTEAESLEKVGNHPQIPRLLAYFEENQEFYLVQDFIDGHNLSDELIPGKPWAETKVKALLQNVLPILDFVHKQGVIHRDVKPDNLLRRKADNQIVLVDFGAVKQISNQTLLIDKSVTKTVAVGTPGYMPSEQARGQPRPNSDIYALGVIAVQALIGIQPMAFQYDPHTGEILWQHLAQVSPELGTILKGMVMYHFRDRYQSAAEVLQRLEQLNSGITSPTSPHVYQPEVLNNSLPKLPTYNPPTQPPLSQKQTLAATPARQPTSPPTSIPSSIGPNRPDSAPLVLGSLLAIFVAAGVGIAFAAREQIVSLFPEDGSLIGNTTEKCTVTAQPALNIRNNPNVNGEQVGEVKNGTKVSLSGNKEGKWVEIKKPRGGWVYSDYLNCGAEVEPVTTVNPTPKPSPSPTPKPTPKPKPVDNGNAILAAAREKYQQGDLPGAIRELSSIPANSSAYQEAQRSIETWRNDWDNAKAQFEQAQAAFDRGDWDEAIAAKNSASDNPYWNKKLENLANKASQRKAKEEEAKNQEPEIPEAPPLEKEPKPESEEKRDSE